MQRCGFRAPTARKIPKTIELYTKICTPFGWKYIKVPILREIQQTFLTSLVKRIGWKTEW